MLVELSCTHNYPPMQKSHGDVGADLRVCQSVKLTPREVTAIRTGVTVEHIEPGYWLKLETKSGAAKNGLLVIGGVIDSGYRGEIVVLVLNTQKHQVVLNPGDSVAQMVIMAHYEPRQHMCVDGESIGVGGLTVRGSNGGVWR